MKKQHTVKQKVLLMKYCLSFRIVFNKIYKQVIAIRSKVVSVRNLSEDRVPAVSSLIDLITASTRRVHPTCSKISAEF